MTKSRSSTTHGKTSPSGAGPKGHCTQQLGLSKPVVLGHRSAPKFDEPPWRLRLPWPSSTPPATVTRVMIFSEQPPQAGLRTLAHLSSKGNRFGRAPPPPPPPLLSLSDLEVPCTVQRSPTTTSFTAVTAESEDESEANHPDDSNGTHNEASTATQLRLDTVSIRASLTPAVSAATSPLSSSSIFFAPWTSRHPAASAHRLETITAGSWTLSQQYATDPAFATRRPRHWWSSLLSRQARAENPQGPLDISELAGTRSRVFDTSRVSSPPRTLRRSWFRRLVRRWSRRHRRLNRQSPTSSTRSKVDEFLQSDLSMRDTRRRRHFARHSPIAPVPPGAAVGRRPDDHKMRGFLRAIGLSCLIRDGRQSIEATSSRYSQRLTRQTRRQVDTSPALRAVAIEDIRLTLSQELEAEERRSDGNERDPRHQFVLFCGSENTGTFYPNRLSPRHHTLEEQVEVSAIRPSMLDRQMPIFFSPPSSTSASGSLRRPSMYQITPPDSPSA